MIDMDVPGTYSRSPNASYNSSFNTSMELNTPIKKINQLSLNSPNSKLPIYPSIHDIFQDNVASSMISKGYSKKLTNNVLQELNLRAQNISNSRFRQQSSSPTKPESPNPTERRNKRYSQIHSKGFQNMPSIQTHYSVEHHIHRNTQTNNHNLTQSSNQPSKSETNQHLSPDMYTKRRKTLNTDDFITYQKTLPSVSPEKTLDSSPIRKISPSKKLMNLNQLLNEKPANSEFKTPFPPSNKLRYSSLEMAGVKPSEAPIYRKPCLSSSKNTIPNLQKKPSIPQLQKKPSIPQLQKKSSIPNLQKKPSLPQLQKKPVPQHPKSSIPTLKNKQSFSEYPRSSTNPTISPSNSSRSLYQPESKIPTKPSLSPSRSSHSLYNKPSLSPSRSSQSLYNRPSLAPSSSSRTLNGSSTKEKNYTVPLPFSLYDKPTISSSQKSLNKFQRFKKRFE